MSYFPFVMELYRLSDTQSSKQIKTRALFWDAWLHFESDIEKTKTLTAQASAHCDSINYPYDHAKILFLNGLILSRQNDYKEAYRLFKGLENYFKKIDDCHALGYTYVNIGSILKRVGLYKESMYYYKQAEETFDNNKFIADKIKNKHNIGVIKHHLGQTTEGIAILKALLTDSISQKELSFKVDVLTSLYYVSQSLSEKEKYARQAYQISQYINNKTSKTYTLINMGALHIYKQNNDSALYYFQKAHDEAKENQDVYSLIHSLYGLSKIYEESHQADSAFSKLKQYLKYKASSSNGDKSVEINRLEASNAIKQYEEELQYANQKVHEHKLKSVMTLLIVVIIATLICYNLWILRKKEKIKKQLKDIENKELSNRLDKERLLNEQYQLKIDIKNRELTANSVIMTEKNLLLRELLTQIDDFARKGLLAEPQEECLKKQIKKQIKTKDEWSYFKQHFEEVHPDFFKQLREAHESLSENDLRLCAYIRIGMTTKQMAQLLSILPETVNTSRYRIRKKIKLKQEESLEDYLRNI